LMTWHTNLMTWRRPNCYNRTRGRRPENDGRAPGASWQWQLVTWRRLLNPEIWTWPKPWIWAWPKPWVTWGPGKTLAGWWQLMRQRATCKVNKCRTAYSIQGYAQNAF
jgi:hypothetical protein